MKILTLMTFFLLVCVFFSNTSVAEKKVQSNTDIFIPNIERAETDIPRIRVEDYEIGAFIGVYSTEDFGTDGIYGLTGSYHFTEDIFFSGTYASSNVSDSSNRNINSNKLSYLNVLFGYNVLPGEVYSGAGKAWSSSTYFVGGLGVTEINETQNLTIVLGGGLRLVPSKRIAVHIDFRDHILNSNLIGSNKSIQNIEITSGASWFF